MKRIRFRKDQDIESYLLRWQSFCFNYFVATDVFVYLKHAPMTGFRFGYAHFLRKAHEIAIKIAGVFGRAQRTASFALLPSSRTPSGRNRTYQFVGAQPVATHHLVMP